MATRDPVGGNPSFLALAAYNPKTMSLIPIFYYWKIISMQPINLLQLYKQIVGSGFRATLIFDQLATFKVACVVRVKWGA